MVTQTCDTEGTVSPNSLRCGGLWRNHQSPVQCQTASTFPLKHSKTFTMTGKKIYRTESVFSSHFFYEVNCTDKKKKRKIIVQSRYIGCWWLIGGSSFLQLEPQNTPSKLSYWLYTCVSWQRLGGIRKPPSSQQHPILCNHLRA